MGKVNMAKWTLVKEHIKKGEHVKTIAVLQDLSINTVYVIKRSTSFKDYRNRIKTNNYTHVMREFIETPISKPKVTTKKPWYRRLA